MKKTVKRLLATIMTVVMILTAIPFGGIDFDSIFATEASAKDISSYSVGDTITYGSYPQSRVTDSSLISALETAGNKYMWVSYNYYSGTGTWNDGKMQPDDDMMWYKDIPYNGNVYRAVWIKKYRPYYTGYRNTDGTYQDDNGYYTGNVYYFKYEPLKWRVLDPAEGFVMCTTAIDAQAYNNYIIYSNSEYYGNSAKTYYASDWANSSLRYWLNNDFYSTAFSSTEKSQIGTTYNENKSIYDSKYDSANTSDKIFLLSYNEVLNSKYGFSSSYSTYDPARQIKSTDYAKCQGCWQSTSTSYYGNSWWRLRSPYYSGSAAYVFNVGYANYNSNVNNTGSGIVPAFKFNPKSTIPESYDNAVYSNVYVDFEIKNSWDNYKTGSTLLSFNPSWFSQDSKTYNHSMAQLASQFAMIGYSKKSDDNKKQPDLETALSKIGFSNFEIQPNAGRDGVNYFIASKQIKLNSTVYNIVFTGFIGSNGKQWNSNFDPYGTESSTTYAENKTLKGKVHLGFNDAKNYAYDALSKYLTKYGYNKENTKFLITGHSRGAATANLVAAKLIDEQTLAYPKNVYTFAFATPNSALKSITNKAGNNYSRIFNIINPEDFVVKVLPTAWNFNKFGTTFTLPSVTNDIFSKIYEAKMQAMFYTLTKGICDKYKNGDSVPNSVVNRLTSYVNNLDEFYNKQIKYSLLSNQGITPYEYFQYTLCPFVNKQNDKSDAIKLAASFLGADPAQILLYSRVTGFFLANGNGVLSQNFADAHLAETYCAYMLSMSESELTTKRSSTLNTVNCPVDIEIYDKSTGELVGKIVDNVVDETIAAKDNAVVMEVDGDSKMFYLPSNGDYEVKLIGNDEGTMDYSVATVDSDIGETERVNFFDVAITDGMVMTGEISSENFVLEDYTLELDNGKTLEPTEQAEDVSNVEINVSASCNGTVSESFTATSGDYVTVSAVADEGYMFTGWYNGSKLVSSDADYSFVAKDNVNLVAKFKENHVHSYNAKVTAPTCTEKGYTTHMCSCGDSYVDSYVNAKGHKDGEWKVTKPATLTATGVRTLYCAVCGAKIRTETIPKLDQQKKVKSVSLGGDFSLNYKKSTKLNPKVETDGSVKYTVKYESSNPKVATVDSNGNVKGVKEWGKKTATITCTVTDEFGNVVTDKCNVTVGYAWWQWIVGIVLFGWIWY